MNSHKITRAGQATIEFTFAMVIIALLIYGLLRIFQWSGMDYAEISYSADQFQTPPGGWQDSQLVDFELGQLGSDTYRTKRLNAFTRKF